MKTITTIAISLLLSLGLLVAPASAEEVAPNDVPWGVNPACVDVAALASTLNEMLLIEKANVAQGNRIIVRLVKRNEMHRAKIAALRELVRELRREAR